MEQLCEIRVVHVQYVPQRYEAHGFQVERGGQIMRSLESDHYSNRVHR